MGLNRVQLTDKLGIISFVIMIFSGLIKWINIWPIDATALFAILTIIFLLIKIRTKIKTILRKNLTSKIAVIIPLSLWIYISVLYSSSNLYVYTKAINYLLIILSFIIPFFMLQNKNDLLFFQKVLASAGLIISFVFVYLYISSGGDLYLTYFQLLENGNPLGIPDYLALGSPVGITAITLSLNKNYYLKILGFIAIFCALILSGRAPLIGLSIVLLIYIYYNYKKIKGLILIRALLFGIILIFVGIKSINSESLERSFQRFVIMFENKSTNNESITYRLDYLEKSSYFFSENPILGIGLGSYGVLTSGKEERDHPHNMILEILVEQGILGFIFFLYFLIALGKVVIQLMKNKDYTYLIFGLVLIFEFLNTMKSSSIVENRLFFAISSVCFISSQLSKKYNRNLKLGNEN